MSLSRPATRWSFSVTVAGRLSPREERQPQVTFLNKICFHPWADDGLRLRKPCQVEQYPTARVTPAGKTAQEACTGEPRD